MTSSLFGDTFSLNVPVSNTCFLGSSVVQNPPANKGDAVLIPGSGRSLGDGNGNPFQYFCLENLMDKGACQVIQSMRSQLTHHNYHMYFCVCVCVCVCV